MVLTVPPEGGDLAGLQFSYADRAFSRLHFARRRYGRSDHTRHASRNKAAVAIHTAPITLLITDEVGFAMRERRNDLWGFQNTSGVLVDYD